MWRLNLLRQHLWAQRQCATCWRLSYFGHQTRCRPSNGPLYLRGAQQGSYRQLKKTLPLFNEAVNFLGRMAANRGNILFVGTKRAQDVIKREAYAAAPYVDRRWLGGMLTTGPCAILSAV